MEEIAKAAAKPETLREEAIAALVEAGRVVAQHGAASTAGQITEANIEEPMPRSPSLSL